jgi:hypothetical protein
MKVCLAGFLILMTSFLLGCQKETFINIPQYSFDVNESMKTCSSPGQFYLCGNYQYPCRSVTNRWSGIEKRKTTKKAYKKSAAKISKSSFSTNKSMENIHEKYDSKNNCVFK